MQAGALILAAGISRRMGRPKLLLPLGEKTVIGHVAETVASSGLRPILVVAGAHEGKIRQALTHLPVEVTYNPCYEEGMGSSLAHGIAALDGRATAAFVFLADQPFVPVVVVEELWRRYVEGKGKGARIVRPVYNHVPGHPVLFDAELFPELQQLQGDEGGRSVIRNHSSEMLAVPFETDLWGADMDTEKDYQRLLKFP